MFSGFISWIQLKLAAAWTAAATFLTGFWAGWTRKNTEILETEKHEARKDLKEAARPVDFGDDLIDKL